MPQGRLIVIDGTDGSGKGTQSALLLETLRGRGLDVELLDFPRYDEPSSYFVRQYLNGVYGTGQKVGPYTASLFYALDRYDASHRIKERLAAGTIFISNRYVSANKGHQTAKLTDPAERHAFLKWLNETEYGMLGIPKPDLTILLHMPSDIAFDLIAKKSDRAYLNNGAKRDIHEADINHLRAAEAAYLEMPTLDETEKWHLITCATDNVPRTIDDIQQEIVRTIEPLLAPSS